MSKIQEAFQNKKAFIGFITGGDPDLETTEKLIVAMAEAGKRCHSGGQYPGPVRRMYDVQAL